MKYLQLYPGRECLQSGGMCSRDPPIYGWYSQKDSHPHSWKRIILSQPTSWPPQTLLQKELDKERGKGKRRDIKKNIITKFLLLNIYIFFHGCFFRSWNFCLCGLSQNTLSNLNLSNNNVQQRKKNIFVICIL